MSYYFNPHGHQCPWHPFSELFGYSSNNWCEEVSCYWISSPVSTYSSIAFVFVAAALFGLLKKKNHPDLKLLLNFFLLIGLGAILYHSTLNYLTQLIAHGFIYAFFSNILLKNFIRQGKLGYAKKNKFLLSFIFVFILLEHILYMQFLPTGIIIPFIYLLVIVTEFMCKKYEEVKVKYHFLFSGFIVLLLAEAFSQMDILKVICDPKSIYFQGHALWHILAAISFALLFLHIYQIYPMKEDEPEIDFDKYTDEDDSLEETEITDQATELELDPMVESSEDLEIDEESVAEEDDDSDEEQIQFDFDSADSSEPENNEVDPEDTEEDKKE